MTTTSASSRSNKNKAVNPSFYGASPAIPTVTASASNTTLQNQNNKCWHRIIPNDNVESSQGADWLARTGSKKIFVLNNLSTYGKNVTDTVASELKTKSVAVVAKNVNSTTTKNYNPITQTITASSSDAIFYGGYDAQAALLTKALQAASFKGRTVTSNGGKSSIFTKDADPTGNSWYFTCGCQDATTAPSTKDFATAYKAK